VRDDRWKRPKNTAKKSNHAACRKFCYSTPAKARKAAKAQSGQGLGVPYFCRKCRCYHLTSKRYFSKKTLTEQGTTAES